MIAAVTGLVLLGDIVLAVPAARAGACLLAVFVAAAAALLAAAAAEQHATRNPGRWQLQALASTALMFALMARGAGARPSSSGDFPLLLVVVAALLIATAAVCVEGPRWRTRVWRLLLDATIVAVTLALAAIVTVGPITTTAPLPAVMFGAYAAAIFAAALAMRSAVRADPFGHDALFLLGVVVLGAWVTGFSARLAGVDQLAFLAAPATALLGALALAGSGWLGLRRPRGEGSGEASDESRLRLVPSAAVAVVVVLLAGTELGGNGSRVAFFGVIALFSLIVARLVFTLIENRQLLRSVERSGVFEEKLRDLGAALMSALDRTEALDLVCRAAQLSFNANSVVLWMVDAPEMEAAEVLGPKRQHILHRRIPVDDTSSLAARVARTGWAEIVSQVPSAGSSNGFLNVLLRAQCLLAVPVIRNRVVQGVLVCVDARNPVAYGPRELAKAELLASQVAVALDNAYQHEQQQRRLEEVTALYRFAQSLHTTVSSSEVASRLLPVLEERLPYTYAAIWVRDPGSGTLRLGAGDSPGGVPLAGVYPSELAARAFSTAEPQHAGLGWVEASAEGYRPPRSGIRSQLAVPIVLERRVLGVVDLESKQANAYSLNDTRLLIALANQAGLAMENLQLRDEARQMEALKELDRMKSELLSTVSHELRTPLSSIKGYATTLLTHEHKLRRAEKREFLEIIDSESDRLRELIENLLDLSRMEAGVLRIDRGPTYLARVAAEVVRKVQLATSMHEVVLDWPEDREVSADSRRLYQVLQNLLTNAVKYSPEGGTITLSARFAGNELVVSVSDQGLGLPEREIERIFDRFHRVGGEVSRRIGGTGLGLAICKALVEAHGGRIWAESEGEGRGSTFRFSIPNRPPVGLARSPLIHGHAPARSARAGVAR